MLYLIFLYLLFLTFSVHLCSVYGFLVVLFFFFFKQKTAYEMRISDWSSDVCSSDLRIEVGAVVIQQATGVVDDAGDFLDATLEHAEGRRIGQHDAGRLRTDCGLQRFDIDIAILVGRDLAHRAAKHRRGRRIRTMRSVRHQDLGDRKSTRLNSS